MRKIITILVTACIVTGFAQSSFSQIILNEKELPADVAYIFIVPYQLNGKYEVILDYGQETKSPKDYKIMNDDGTDRKFNSLGDVFNFVAKEWDYEESIKMRDDEGEYNSYLFRRKT